MAVNPPPIGDAANSQRWLDWYNQINQQFEDLTGRAHNALSGLQGGTVNQYFHLDSDQFDSVTAADPLKIKEFTVAGLPAATGWQSHLVTVSDETGGYTVAFSDGTNWRRVQDLAVVS